MAGIDIDGITKNFGRTEVLRRVDLDIRPGEFMTLVGPSGCGKSTLLRIVAGLEMQSSGSVRIAETAVDGLRPRDRDLAMVFQSYALYPHMSVRKNIGFGLSLSGAAKESVAERVGRVAGMLQIGELLDRRPRELSGGQRQRVALGRAMVRHPKAFLMDEPLSNLDAKLRVHMRAEIAQLHRRLGTTFIYVTHDQAEAMTMSDRIAVMMDGAVLQVAPPEVVYNDPKDIRVAEFIGSPKINVLPAMVTADGTLAVEDRMIRLAPAARTGELVRLAFRPEHAALAAPERAALLGRVAHLENLGSDLLVHILAGEEEHPLVVRTAPGAIRPQIGETVGIDLAGRLPLLFGQDGKRIDVAPAAPATTRETAHG
jgi:multiple sugar transport system ATP-binding protein